MTDVDLDCVGLLSSPPTHHSRKGYRDRIFVSLKGIFKEKVLRNPTHPSRPVYSEPQRVLRRQSTVDLDVSKLTVDSNHTSYRRTDHGVDPTDLVGPLPVRRETQVR